MRGRYPATPEEYVEKVEGSELARERAQVVVELMAGTRRLQEACQRLDVHETRMHQLRHRGWQWLVRAMEPGVPGRPPAQSVADAERIRELEQRLAQKELELQEALVRTEVALIVPQRLQVEPVKKGQRPSVKLRKQKPR